MEEILKAAAFAAAAHIHQRRKGLDEPYINHPIRVARHAQVCGLSPEAMVAALLHDVVEDTPVTLEAIQAEFPARIAELVQLLTKWWPDDADPELKRREKPKFYGALLQDQEAIEVKLLDRADNLDDMVRMVPRARAWAERYLKKTESELAPVLEASKNPRVQETYRRSLTTLKRALSEAASRGGRA